MVDEHELLVHISTPATRQNDQIYRSLASAYLGFEPYRNEIERSPQHDVSSQFATSRVSNSTPPNRGSSFRGSINTSILSTSKDSYGSFPSHLSSDGHVQGYVDASCNNATQDDFEPTSSRLARLERIHQNWKAQANPKSSAASKRRSIRDVASSPEDADTAFIEDTQAAAQALQSQLQDSFSMTWEDTDEDGEEAGGGMLESPSSSAMPVGETTVAASEESASPSAASSPRVPTADVSRFENTRPEKAGSTEVRVSASLSPHPESSGVAPEQRASLRPDDVPKSASIEIEEQENTASDAAVADNADPPIDFTTYPNYVLSPPPRIGVGTPKIWPSQVTPYLAAIKNQNPTRFKPIKKLHNPGMNERGRWAIDFSRWTAQAQKDLWDRIREPLLDGRLGWSASLYRENGTSETLGDVCLFNWGELAEHTWLLLWLCSDGSIVGAGLKWMAAGAAILEME